MRCVCVSNSVLVVFGTNLASDTFHNSYKVKLRENKSCDYLIGRLLGLQQCLWGVLAVIEFLLKTLSLFSPLLATQSGQPCLDHIGDFFNTEDTLSLCQQTTPHAGQLLTRLGFVFHRMKSVFILRSPWSF